MVRADDPHPPRAAPRRSLVSPPTAPAAEDSSRSVSPQESMPSAARSRPQSVASHYLPCDPDTQQQQQQQQQGTEYERDIDGMSAVSSQSSHHPRPQLQQHASRSHPSGTTTQAGLSPADTPMTANLMSEPESSHSVAYRSGYQAGAAARAAAARVALRSELSAEASARTLAPNEAAAEQQSGHAASHPVNPPSTASTAFSVDDLVSHALAKAHGAARSARSTISTTHHSTAAAAAPPSSSRPLSHVVGVPVDEVSTDPHAGKTAARITSAPSVAGGTSAPVYPAAPPSGVREGGEGVADAAPAPHCTPVTPMLADDLPQGGGGAGGQQQHPQVLRSSFDAANMGGRASAVSDRDRDREHPRSDRIYTPLDYSYHSEKSFQDPHPPAHSPPPAARGEMQTPSGKGSPDSSFLSHDGLPTPWESTAQAAAAAAPPARSDAADDSSIDMMQSRVAIEAGMPAEALEEGLGEHASRGYLSHPSAAVNVSGGGVDRTLSYPPEQEGGGGYTDDADASADADADIVQAAKRSSSGVAGQRQQQQQQQPFYASRMHWQGTGSGDASALVAVTDPDADASTATRVGGLGFSQGHGESTSNWTSTPATGKLPLHNTMVSNPLAIEADPTVPHATRTPVGAVRATPFADGDFPTSLCSSTGVPAAAAEVVEDGGDVVAPASGAARTHHSLGYHDDDDDEGHDRAHTAYATRDAKRVRDHAAAEASRTLPATTSAAAAASAASSSTPYESTRAGYQSEGRMGDVPVPVPPQTLAPAQERGSSAYSSQPRRSASRSSGRDVAAAIGGAGGGNDPMAALYASGWGFQKAEAPAKQPPPRDDAPARPPRVGRAGLESPPRAPPSAPPTTTTGAGGGPAPAPTPLRPRGATLGARPRGGAPEATPPTRLAKPPSTAGRSFKQQIWGEGSSSGGRGAEQRPPAAAAGAGAPPAPTRIDDEGGHAGADASTRTVAAAPAADHPRPRARDPKNLVSPAMPARLSGGDGGEGQGDATAATDATGAISNNSYDDDDNRRGTRSLVGDGHGGCLSMPCGYGGAAAAAAPGGPDSYGRDGHYEEPQQRVVYSDVPSAGVGPVSLPHAHPPRMSSAEPPPQGVREPATSAPPSMAHALPAHAQPTYTLGAAAPAGQRDMGVAEITTSWGVVERAAGHGAAAGGSGVDVGVGVDVDAGITVDTPIGGGLEMPPPPGAPADDVWGPMPPLADPTLPSTADADPFGYPPGTCTHATLPAASASQQAIGTESAGVERHQYEYQRHPHDGFEGGFVEGGDTLYSRTPLNVGVADGGVLGNELHPHPQPQQLPLAGIPGAVIPAGAPAALATTAAPAPTGPHPLEGVRELGAAGVPVPTATLPAEYTSQPWASAPAAAAVPDTADATVPILPQYVPSAGVSVVTAASVPMSSVPAVEPAAVAAAVVSIDHSASAPTVSVHAVPSVAGGHHRQLTDPHPHHSSVQLVPTASAPPPHATPRPLAVVRPEDVMQPHSTPVGAPVSGTAPPASVAPHPATPAMADDASAARTTALFAENPLTPEPMAEMVAPQPHGHPSASAAAPPPPQVSRSGPTATAPVAHAFTSVAGDRPPPAREMLAIAPPQRQGTRSGSGGQASVAAMPVATATATPTTVAKPTPAPARTSTTQRPAGPPTTAGRGGTRSGSSRAHARGGGGAVPRAAGGGGGGGLASSAPRSAAPVAGAVPRSRSGAAAQRPTGTAVAVAPSSSATTAASRANNGTRRTLAVAGGVHTNVSAGVPRQDQPGEQVKSTAQPRAYSPRVGRARSTGAAAGRARGSSAMAAGGGGERDGEEERDTARPVLRRDGGAVVRTSTPPGGARQRTFRCGRGEAAEKAAASPAARSPRSGTPTRERYKPSVAPHEPAGSSVLRGAKSDGMKARIRVGTPDAATTELRRILSTPQQGGATPTRGGARAHDAAESHRRRLFPVGGATATAAATPKQKPIPIPDAPPATPATAAATPRGQREVAGGAAAADGVGSPARATGKLAAAREARRRAGTTAAKPTTPRAKPGRIARGMGGAPAPAPAPYSPGALTQPRTPRRAATVVSLTQGGVATPASTRPGGHTTMLATPGGGGGSDRVCGARTLAVPEALQLAAYRAHAMAKRLHALKHATLASAVEKLHPRAAAASEAAVCACVAERRMAEMSVAHVRGTIAAGHGGIGEGVTAALEDACRAHEAAAYTARRATFHLPTVVCPLLEQVFGDGAAVAHRVVSLHRTRLDADAGAFAAAAHAAGAEVPALTRAVREQHKQLRANIAGLVEKVNAVASRRAYAAQVRAAAERLGVAAAQP